VNFRYAPLCHRRAALKRFLNNLVNRHVFWPSRQGDSGTSRRVDHASRAAGGCARRRPKSRQTAPNHEMQGGAMKAPPGITVRRTLTQALCQNTRHGPATRVWDETEFRNLPGLAEGRHRCRWRQARGQPASAALKSRHAGGSKVATVRNPLDGLARHHRAKRALVGSHQLRRQHRYRGAARRGVLDRPGIRDPRRQEGSLFCQGQIRIARDVIRVDVNRCSA
jgi:hypothetical protein